MKKRTHPMKRSAIRRSQKRLKRSPLRRVSKQRAKELREYSALRREFLAENKTCAVYPFLKAVDVHHMDGREHVKLNDQSKWLAVSRQGHDFIHQNPKAARLAGWLK